jgi:hypothetical protein
MLPLTSLVNIDILIGFKMQHKNMNIENRLVWENKNI